MPPNVTYTQVNQDDIDGMALADLLASSTGPCWFNGVDFSGEDFSRKDFRGARFERCILAGTRFAAAKLESTEWINCRAAQAHFNTATLTDARFQGCDLNNSSWQRSKLSHAHFEGCKLTGANFLDVASLGLEFTECILRAAFLSGISFYKSELKNLDFADADLSHCDFRKAVFVDGGSLSLARVNGARFEDADLRDACLDGLKLVDAKQFKGAIISRSQASMLLSGLGLTVL